MSQQSETSSEFNHRVYMSRNFPHSRSYLTDSDAKNTLLTYQYTLDDIKANYKTPKVTFGTPATGKKKLKLFKK